MSTSRRSVLTGTAAALAGGAALNAAVIIAAKAEEKIPQKGGITDPIFALIERHRAMREEIRTTDHDGPDGDACLEDVARLDGIEQAILQAPLVSLASTAAALRYLNHLDGGIFIEASSDAFLDRLADAIERMAVRS